MSYTVVGVLLRQSTAACGQGLARPQKSMHSAHAPRTDGHGNRQLSHLVVDEAGVLIHLVREALEVNARRANLRRTFGASLHREETANDDRKKELFTQRHYLTFKNTPPGVEQKRWYHIM